jgi:MinD-like ATPase involved in chromosome partitioning or flagellar assembly
MIIAVASGKGGTGKTMVATNTACRSSARSLSNRRLIVLLSFTKQYNYC